MKLKILILATFLLLVSTVHAQTITSVVTPSQLVTLPAPQTGINLTVSPIFINLTTDPGVAISNQFKVRNNNNFKEQLHLTIAKFQSSASTGQPVIQEIGKDDQFAQWIKFSENSFTIDPNENKTIKFTITPAKDAALGYYYAIVISRVHEGTTNQNGSVVSGSPALPILLEVRSPNAKRELQLTNFETSSLFYEYLPAEFHINVKNTGNIHIVPAGDIFIDWGTVKDIDVLQANAAKGTILPSGERSYIAQWNNGFITREPKIDDNGRPVTDSKGKLVYTTKWHWDKFNSFRIGKYTAHLLMIYDNGQRDVPLEGTVSFWVVPWKLLLGGLVIAYFALIGIKNTLANGWRKLMTIGKR